jgi:hypothetical protein
VEIFLYTFQKLIILIIHEENTKNEIERFPLIYINFNFDFLDLHNVFLEHYFANEFIRTIVFEAI